MLPSPFSISKSKVSPALSVGSIALRPASFSGRGRLVILKSFTGFVPCFATVTFPEGYSSEIWPDFGFWTEVFSSLASLDG